MNHRGLQRTLFRMQMDPEFCEAIMAAREDAIATTDLDPEEVAHLASLDPAAIRRELARIETTGADAHAAYQLAVELRPGGGPPAPTWAEVSAYGA